MEVSDSQFFLGEVTQIAAFGDRISRSIFGFLPLAFAPYYVRVGFHGPKTKSRPFRK
jgi:hypothetical protein